MATDRQNQYIDDLLDLMTSRVYRSRHQSRVPGPDGYRIIEDLVDDTGVGPDNETDNKIIIDEIILDCGHRARGNLGGLCTFCDSLICVSCIALCSSCGLATCPPDRVIANYDGQDKPYCRYCSEEIERSMRLRKVGRCVISFFFSEPDKKQEYK